MLGADRDRIAEAERVGFESACLAGAAFALVGDQNCGLAGFAHEIGEGAIGRRRTRARIDEKEHGVGLRHRRRGLRLHPCRRGSLAMRLLQPRGVDDLETTDRRAFPRLPGDRA